MNILVISFIASHNIKDNAGNTNYIYSITSYLQSLGHKIYFLYINTKIQNYDLKAMQDKWDYTQVLDAFDLDIWNSAKFKNLDFAYKSYIGEAANNICKKVNIDMCICHYFLFSKLLETLPKNIVKVIDTHDLFTNRFAYLNKHLLNKEFFSLTKKHEAAYLNRADIILARTNQEKDFFNTITNSNKSLTITYFDKNSKFLDKNYTGLKSIGFVGSYNKINVLCILKFLNEFDKEYKKGNFKDIKIEVAGNILHNYKQIYRFFKFSNRWKLFITHFSFRTFFNLLKPNLAKPFIKVISKRDYFVNNGFVENLDDFYNRVDLIILPILLGTGVNIKTAEALSKGVPVISTVNGFKGFNSNEIEHNATNIKQLIKFIKNIQNYPIKLQNLANISKQIYLDYKNTLDKNLNTFFARVKEIKSLQETHSKANLVFPEVYNPKVSIIVPVYRNLQLTLNCLNAILQNTKENSYEIIVVDDASDDEVINLKSYVKNVKIIRNPKNLGYLKSCNTASEVAQGEYLLFLNNDTLVHKDWLKYILKTFELRTDAGIVGGKLLNLDGSIQEAGSFIANTKITGSINNGNSPLYSCNYLRPVDYISGACLCIPKKLFFEVGKLDEIYGHGYAEDQDLCMKVRQLGYEVYYQPKAKITHLGSQTFTKVEKKHLIKKNNKIFFSKWKKQLHKENLFLKGDEDYHISELFLLRNRSKNKKTILCFDDGIPSNMHGGGKSSLGFLELFVELGFNVKFFPENIDFSYEKNNLEYLQQKGIEVIYPNTEIMPFLENYGKFIDYVFLQRPYSIKYINDLKKFTRAKIIYYGHDLHYLRLQRSLNFNKNNKDIEILCTQLKEIEFKLIKISDVVYYPSILEVTLLQQEIPYANINLLTPYYYNTNKLNTLPNKPINKRHNILFVVSTHQPNIDGLLWFLQEVWDKLLKQTNNSIHLNIVGNIIEKFQNIYLKNINLENVKFLGQINEEELIKVYHNTRVAICPMLYGIGVMSKIVEAIYYKVPIVSTNIGTEGLVGDYIDLVYTANSSSDFIKQIIHIFDEKYIYNDEKAKKYIDDYFSRECIIKQLKDNYIINC